MIIEVLIICVTCYILFADYFSAKAELLREIAREKEIKNNEWEQFDGET